jgi:hypothetical protein
MAAGKHVKMDTRAWESLKLKLKEAGNLHVKIGVLGDKPVTAAAEAGAESINAIELAAIHEFGSPAAGVPERSFLRRAFGFGKGAPGQATVMQKLAQGIVTGKATPLQAYNLLGVWGVKQVKDTIAAGPHIPPPLADSTVAKKGSDRPLVDTGRLVNSISHQVEAGREEVSLEVGTTSNMGPVQQ